MSALKWVYLRLACTCEETCLSFRPPNASLYASSTCRYLRLLASPFSRGLKKAEWKRHLLNNQTWLLSLCPTISLALVVQRLDNAIHRINHYPVDSVVCFVNTYPLDIPLTNRVWAPYRKLQTEFFPLRFIVQAWSARSIEGKKRGSLKAYSTDREDEVSKIVILSLLCVWRVR